LLGIPTGQVRSNRWPEEVEVSQKAVGTETRRGAASAAPDKPATSAEAFSAALKGLMATLNKQAARNTDVIDVFARALRDLDREVKDERMRREILERRLRETDAQVEALARVVAALARQGWVN
jgi:hypothetical protein